MSLAAPFGAWAGRPPLLRRPVLVSLAAPFGA